MSPLNNSFKMGIYIYLISETKINDSFPTAQFFIEWYSCPCFLDRNSEWSGILLYVREDILSKRIKVKVIHSAFERFF